VSTDDYIKWFDPLTLDTAQQWLDTLLADLREALEAGEPPTVVDIGGHLLDWIDPEEPWPRAATVGGQVLDLRGVDIADDDDVKAVVGELWDALLKNVLLAAAAVERLLLDGTMP
jgi:hypothetical protein